MHDEIRLTESCEGLPLSFCLPPRSLYLLVFRRHCMTDYLCGARYHRDNTKPSRVPSVSFGKLIHRSFHDFGSSNGLPSTIRNEKRPQNKITLSLLDYWRVIWSHHSYVPLLIVGPDRTQLVSQNGGRKKSGYEIHIMFNQA